MAEEKGALQLGRELVKDKRHAAVSLSLSGFVGCDAYNRSRVGMETSVKRFLVRVYGQSFFLAVLTVGGSALVEYYDHHKGSGSKVYQYTKQFLPLYSSSQKE